jgi:hypothetical protein
MPGDLCTPPRLSLVKQTEAVLNAAKANASRAANGKRLSEMRKKKVEAKGA